MIALDLSFVPSLDNADVITNACAVVPLEERPLPSPLLYHKLSHVSRSQDFPSSTVRRPSFTVVSDHDCRIAYGRGNRVPCVTTDDRRTFCDLRSAVVCDHDTEN